MKFAFIVPPIGMPRAGSIDGIRRRFRSEKKQIHREFFQLLHDPNLDRLIVMTTCSSQLVAIIPARTKRATLLHSEPPMIRLGPPPPPRPRSEEHTSEL